MANLKILAVAVISGKAGYVFLSGAELQDWGITVRYVGTPTDLAGFVQERINELQPDVVVTEKCDDRSRKGKKSRSLISAIVNTAANNYALDVSVPRPRNFKTKYEEAKSLVQDHPVLIGYLPSRNRRIFDFEPRNMVIFEALALAETVRLGPPDKLVAAMG